MNSGSEISFSAERQLAREKRNAAISSVVVAILAFILLCLLLYFVAIVVPQQKVQNIIGFSSASFEEKKDVEKPVVPNRVKRPPSAPARSEVSAISAITDSPVAIAEVNFDEVSVPFNFTDGVEFGEDFYVGDSGGFAGGFGSTSKSDGSLEGYLYDFKQDKKGQLKKDYVVGNDQDFADSILDFQKSKFSAKGLSDHYKAKIPLFVKYIAIPATSADAAPKYFGVEQEVKPSGWLAHYTGRVRAPETGRYRFVGAGDDYLSVAVNGKERLVAPWPNLRKYLVKRGVNASDNTDEQGPFAGQTLVYGSWFNLRKGELIDLSIGIGEHPGGKVGFLLLVEQEGKNYRTNDEGIRVLPPLVFGDLSIQEEDSLRQFPNWEFELDDIPVFYAKDAK